MTIVGVKGLIPYGNIGCQRVNQNLKCLFSTEKTERQNSYILGLEDEGDTSSGERRSTRCALKLQGTVVMKVGCHLPTPAKSRFQTVVYQKENALLVFVFEKLLRSRTVLLKYIITTTAQQIKCRFLPARRYASAGYSDRDVSVCLSVHLSRAGIVSKRRKLAA